MGVPSQGPMPARRSGTVDQRLSFRKIAWARRLASVGGGGGARVGSAVPPLSIEGRPAGWARAGLWSAAGPGLGSTAGRTAPVRIDVVFMARASRPRLSETRPEWRVLRGRPGPKVSVTRDASPAPGATVEQARRTSPSLPDRAVAANVRRILR